MASVRERYFDVVPSVFFGSLVLRASIASMVLTGCNPDSSGLGEGGGSESSSTGTGGTTSSSGEAGEGVDEESGGDTTGDEGSVPCGYPGMLGDLGYELVAYPPRDEQDVNYHEFEPEEFGDCYFDGIFDPSLDPDDMALGTGHNFEVFVYHPQDTEGIGQKNSTTARQSSLHPPTATTSLPTFRILRRVIITTEIRLRHG